MSGMCRDQKGRSKMSGSACLHGMCRGQKRQFQHVWNVLWSKYQFRHLWNPSWSQTSISPCLLKIVIFRMECFGVQNVGLSSNSKTYGEELEKEGDEW